MQSWKWKSKTPITHIPTCNLPMSCWQKCRKRYSSHDTKVVTLPPHHPHRAMRRFHILHKSVCIPTDWADWASRPFCLLEVHLVPRLSSYRNSGATRAARGAWAEPHSWVNRRAFACFSPFQSHFVGALNTVLSKKKKVIHDKNRTFSTRVFSCRFLSSS